MDLFSKCHEIATRLAALFTHSATSEEEAEHRAWMAESEAHRKLARRILDRDHYEANRRLCMQFSPHEAWNKVFPLLGTSQTGRSLFAFRKTLKYVALVLLLVLPLSVFVYRWMDDDRISDIAPGTQGGELTLANGHTYSLSDKTIPEHAGRSCIFSGNELNYKIATNKPQANSLFNTLRTLSGMEYHVILSDGTKIHLNACTQITYPVCFSDSTRMVTIEGEAYFDVAPDARHPFIVQMPHASVRVTGTSFNVRAYADEESESVTLVSGKVQIGRGDECFTLCPGEHYAFHKIGLTDAVKMVDTRLYASWAAGSFVFLNVPLENVMSYLSKWYGFGYEFEDEASRKVRIGANLDRYANMNPIIDMIRELNLVNVKQRNGKLYISEKR